MRISLFPPPINYAKKMPFAKIIYFTEKISMCNILVHVYNKKYRQHQTKVICFKILQ